MQKFKTNTDPTANGITLIALIITIIIMLILAGVTISVVVNGGLFGQAKNAKELTEMESVKEKINILIGEYGTEKHTKGTTFMDFFEQKKTDGEIDNVVDNGDGTYTIEKDGYEVIVSDSSLLITDISKIGADTASGTAPQFTVVTTKVNGAAVTTGETEKAITINITNIAEFGSNYAIEVKSPSGTVLTKEASVTSGQTGQASYKVTEKGIYTITVTGTKEGITKTAVKTEAITIALATTTTQFNKAHGIIEIVWLDANNNVIVNPEAPMLGGLTPVKWTGAPGSYVEETTTSSDTDWYSYMAQTGATTTSGTSKWANAKVVNGANEAYFVWIPRYAYKITYFDTAANRDTYRNNPSSTTGIIGYSNIDGMVNIQVTPGTKKLVTGSAPTNVTGEVKTVGYQDYIPHPAFTFGTDSSKEKTGFWVGKYEPSGTTTEITIKPNVASLRIQTVSTFFSAGLGVKTTYNLAGDTHIMKNTEWGAVAYLTDSKYGRNGTKVTINNSNSWITGNAGNTVSADSSYTETNGYNTEKGILASTTGNIFGIYDMSGRRI